MSTSIRTDDPHARRPVTEADLPAYFLRGAKPPAESRVGGEFEKFAVRRDTGDHLAYEGPGGLGGILGSLADRFGWVPFVNELGRVTALSRGGASVSLEPGGRLEFASAPAATAAGVADQYAAHLAELRQVAPAGVAWLAAGVSPMRDAESIPFMPRRRHAVMAEYLPARSPTALTMMKATASTQAALDYAGEADAARKFTAAVKLGVFANALWANGPVYGGRPTGLASYRGHVWRHMDPDRCGLLLKLLEGGFSFRAWADYLLDVPMLFTYVDGRYRPAGGRTFRDFARRGLDGYFPTLADWDVHQTTAFTEVRLKSFIEIRGADATGRALAVALPAFWRGLLYDAEALDAAGRLADSVPCADLPVVFEAAYTRGQAGEYRGRRLADWCRELVDIAEGGLSRLPGGDRELLGPAREVLERGRSPGEEFAANGPDPADAAGVMKWFELP